MAPLCQSGFNLQDYHTAKYQEINSRFDAVDRRFHLIQHIEVHGKTPEHFPKRVGAFCKLGRQENLRALASLLEAYEFTAWEDWEEDREPEDQLKLRRSDQTVAEFYVERNPKAAHFELASRIGLEYDTIKDLMERFEDYDGSPTGNIRTKRKERADKGSSFEKASPSNAASLTEEIHQGRIGGYKQTQLSSTAETGRTTSSQETDDPWKV